MCVCFSFRNQEPDDLVMLESTLWDPILEWIGQKHQIKPLVTNSLITKSCLNVLEKEKLVKIFKGYNCWGLTGSFSYNALVY